MKPLGSVPESSDKKTGRADRQGDILGYACMSIADQDVAAQEYRLR